MSLACIPSAESDIFWRELCGGFVCVNISPSGLGLQEFLEWGGLTGREPAGGAEVGSRALPSAHTAHHSTPRG